MWSSSLAIFVSKGLEKMKKIYDRCMYILHLLKSLKDEFHKIANNHNS